MRKLRGVWNPEVNQSCFVGLVNSMAKLEDELTAMLEEGYRRTGEETGYWARYYLREVRKKGGLATAKRLLGSQVEGLSEAFKRALVAGAVTGGGLTVIANAPNPAGFAILRGSFEHETIDPLTLFLAALPPTLIAVAAFRLL